jgi:hypothetical protein
MYRTSVALVAVLFSSVIAAGPRMTTEARADACLPTDIIDGSTADQAARKMEAAGFVQPHDLTKGCDNYWYAHATSNGTPVDVVLPPGGDPFVAHDS